MGETGRWLAQVPPLFADVLFNPAAWYEMEFTGPAALTVVASGTSLQMADNQDGTRTRHIVGGPLRDRTVMASDRWHSVSDTAAGAMVTSYYPADEPSAGQAALFHAAAWACKMLCPVGVVSILLYINPLYFPPSTRIEVPLMYPACSDARKATRAASSSGLPMRPTGTGAA